MVSESVFKFCRLRLGMKPVFDYVTSRSKLLGVADLPIRTVFDVGANVGKMARRYHKLFPDAKVYCFEPVPATYQRLQSWACRQRGAVQAFNMALGSEPGYSSIYWNLRHSGASTLVCPSSEPPEDIVSLPVRVETLDNVAKSLPIRDHIFVKIDVQGFDLEVIKGGTNLLERAAAVIVEIATPESQGVEPTFPEFMRVMSDLGYMYRGNLLHGYVDGISHYADAVFIKPPSACQ